MDIAWWNVEKRRLSGALLKSMADNSNFWKTIQEFSSKIETFLQLSYSTDISPVLAEQIEVFRRVVNSQVPNAELNNIHFKCEDVRTLAQDIRKTIAALPRGQHKDKILEVFEDMQDSLLRIQEEGQRDCMLQSSFRSPLWPAGKESLLKEAQNAVISQTTAKIIFRSIIDEEDASVIWNLVSVFFQNESVHQLLKDTKMILFFISTISG